MPKTWVTPWASSVRTTSWAPFCWFAFAFLSMTDLLVSLFCVCEFLGGVPAEVGLEEALGFGECEAEFFTV
jgi:hypothetical protein